HYASYRDGVWKHLGKQAVDGSSGMIHSNETSREFYRTRHFIDSKKLRKVLKTAKTSLTSEQLQAIENVGYVAQQASGAPSELFVQGYALYIKIATAKDKFVGQFPYGFKDIMDMSVFSDNPEHDLYSLETTARTEVPLLSTFIDSHWTKFEPITKESSD